jgi:hypothetical protein
MVLMIIKMKSPMRPLSYEEIVRGWARALVEKEAAIPSSDDVQGKFEDYESDIIELVGLESYKQILRKYLEVLHSRLPLSSN